MQGFGLPEPDEISSVEGIAAFGTGFMFGGK